MWSSDAAGRRLLRCHPSLAPMHQDVQPGADLTATAESWGMEHRVPQKGSGEAICEQVLNQTV